MTPSAPAAFVPAHDFFVGIDSDGCAFDSMEIKQKECFIPVTIKTFGLQAVSKYWRETHEFVNLYSKHRGANRWPALVRVFELLEGRPEVRARGARLPDWRALKAFCESGAPLTNRALEEWAAGHPNPVFETALAWSAAVNAAIDHMVEGLAPFPLVRESLARLAPAADMMVISQTPTAALEKEWTEHDIARYVALIGGQELGTKGEILKAAAGGKYPSERILMIGDAPGDLKAARGSGALFYPINPGAEEASWERFHGEAIDRFLDGSYAGAYERALIEEFEQLLPEHPPWQ